MHYSPSSRYILPSFEERTAYGTKTMDPYSKLFENRTIFLAAPVDGTSASDLVAQLLGLEAQSDTEDITLYINSPGGSISDMSMIIDTINYIKPDVSTICLGLAASAAAVLLAAGAPGKRFALPNSRIMIHQPRTGDSGRGQASDIQIQAEEIMRSRTWMEEFLSAHSNQPLDVVHRDLERDKFLTAQQALEYGLIDDIVARKD